LLLTTLNNILKIFSTQKGTHQISRPQHVAEAGREYRGPATTLTDSNHSCSARSLRK